MNFCKMFFFLKDFVKVGREKNPLNWKRERKNSTKFIINVRKVNAIS